LLAARESAKNVNTTIVQSTREKRKSFSANIKAFNQRREAVRRKEREDIVEASTVKGAISRSRTSVASSTRGFLGRIMDFLGTLLVGWAITNLPNIIKMAQSLMKRMQTYFGFLNQFKDGLQDFLISFGSMVGGVASSLGNFDFIAMKKLIDKGMGKMKDSFVQMSNSLNNVIVTLKQDINKLLGLDLFDIPGSDGDDGGDDSGGGSGDPAGIPAAGGNKFSGEAAKIPPEGKALLDAIAGSESGGYNRRYPSKTFSGYDDHPRKRELILSGPNKGLRSDAAGRYQFLSSTWDQYKRPGAKFTPEEQDLAAYRLAIAAYGYGEQGLLKALREDPLKVANKLSGTWTSLPGGIEPNNATNGFLNRYNASVKRYRQQQSRPAPAEAQKVSNFTMNNASEPGAYAGGDPEKSPRIGDIISSNNSQKSTLLASNLQQTRQKPGTNTLLYNNEVIKTVYMPSNSYGGDVIVLAGGVNSGRRNRFLNSLA